MTAESNPSAKSAKDTVWPDLLADPEAIAGYVCELSPYEVSEEQIEEQCHGCQAKLTWVELSTLSLDDDHNQPSKSPQKNVNALPISTMPPLLVDQSHLQDGYHRLRRLLADGVTHHWAYVIEDAPENALEAKPVKASRWDALYDLSP